MTLPPKNVRTFIRGVCQAWASRPLEGVELQVVVEQEGGWICSAGLVGVDAVAHRQTAIPTEKPGSSGRALLAAVLAEFQSDAKPAAPTAGVPAAKVPAPGKMIVHLANMELVEVDRDAFLDVCSTLNDLRLVETVDELEPKQRELLEAQIPGGLERLRQTMEATDDGEPG